MRNLLIVGKRFGRLILLNRLNKTMNGGYYWLCRCDCGQETKVQSSNLSAGHTISCGCFRKEQSKLRASTDIVQYRPLKGSTRLNIRKPGGSFRRLLAIYKRAAKKNLREFSLSEEEFRQLTKSVCFYCGVEPSQISKTNTEQYIYNGVDRKDNSVGYTTENSVPCCWPCNELKGDRNIDDFLARIQKIISSCSAIKKL